jgi:hypothetical protein
MQQGDGGGLRYAMQAMQVLRERGQPRVSQRQGESFSALFDMASSRAHQAAHPTDDDECTDRPADYTDADLLLVGSAAGLD